MRQHDHSHLCVPKRGVRVISINLGKYSVFAYVFVRERLCNGSPMSGIWGPFRFPFPWFCLNQVSQWQIVPVGWANLFDWSAMRKWTVSLCWMNTWANGQMGKKSCAEFIQCPFPFLVYLYCFVPHPVFCFWNHVLVGPPFLPTCYA